MCVAPVQMHYIDLIIHVHILGAYVHVCARYEVSLIKPVAREHYLQTMTQDNKNR